MRSEAGMLCRFHHQTDEWCYIKPNRRAYFQNNVNIILIIRQYAVQYKKLILIHMSSIVKNASKARLEARVSVEVHNKIKRAAELQGRTITDFIVAAAQDAAQHAIEQAEIIRISLDDQETFAKALINPPEPVVALRRAFERRKALLQPE